MDTCGKETVPVVSWRGVSLCAVGAAIITVAAGCGDGPTVPSRIATTVTVAPAETDLTALGETIQLSARVADQNGQLIAGASVRWSSSAPAVATVDGSGLATAAGNGKATVTAVSGDARGTATVTVAQTVASLSVEPTHLASAHAGKQGSDTIVVIALDSRGSSVAGTEYQWSTDRHSGWVFPSQDSLTTLVPSTGVTDDRGRFSAVWVAGWPGEGVLALRVGEVDTAFATVSTVPDNEPVGGGAYIYTDHWSHISEGQSIDITPLTETPGTYYAAIQWPGGYTGLQRGGSRYDRQLQFSVWDSDEGPTTLLDKADDVLCGNFGHEGTGVACELEYPWAVMQTYRFEVSWTAQGSGNAVTLHVTDLASEAKRWVATILYGKPIVSRSVGMFVEDFTGKPRHCLERKVMRAAIRRPRIRYGGEWILVDEMTEGKLGRHTEDVNNPGSPPCANITASPSEYGLVLTVGGEHVSHPEKPWCCYRVPGN